MFALCKPKHQGSTPRGTPGNFGPKWPTPCWFESRRYRSQIAAEWLQIAQRSQWRAYRKPPSLFRMVPSLTPYDLTFSPKWGFHSICLQDTRIVISPRRVIGYTSCLVLGYGFQVGGSNGAFSGYIKSRQAAILDNFEWPYLRKGSFDPFI